MESLTIRADDGFELAARRFSPAGRLRGVIVLANAMGVKQDFYFPFAEFLAEQGFAVQTFDYRGIGASVPEPFRRSLRGFEADLFIWARRDYNAALREARAWQPGVPLFIIGHSLGGQLPGLLPDLHLVDGMITVASGNGYWLKNALPTRRTVWLLWYFAAPVYTRLFGYFPGKKLKKVGDLPKGVIRQWAQWCKNPHYVVDREGRPIREGYEQIRVPILAFGFADDEMMSRWSIDSMHDKYRNARVERRYVAPQHVQAGRIGHFGFFRQQFRDTLWQQALTWLARRAWQIERGRRRIA